MIPTTLINRPITHCGTPSRRPRFPRSSPRTPSLCFYASRCLLVGHQLPPRTYAYARPHRCAELSCLSFLHMFTLPSLLPSSLHANTHIPPRPTLYIFIHIALHVLRLHDSSLFITPSTYIASASHHVVLNLLSSRTYISLLPPYLHSCHSRLCLSFPIDLVHPTLTLSSCYVHLTLILPHRPRSTHQAAITPHPALGLPCQYSLLVCFPSLIHIGIPRPRHSKSRP